MKTSSTHQKLRKLTNETAHKPKPVLPKVRSLWSELSYLLLRLFPPKVKNSMCKYYGHVLTDRHWKGEFPVCDQCGMQIRSKAELRTALIKAASVSEKTGAKR
ncbi:MAG: hypothetical protein K2W95_07305 [Candidatus Obscuribacterales bacterium]|nr:hypothetical protein [Candidatus Obscuribacterales bacterium]